MFVHVYKKIFFLLFMMLCLLPLYANESIAKKDNKTSDALIDAIVSKWTGDLDGMLEKGMIRVLVVPSKMMYHIEKGKKSGIFYELVTGFEKSINKRYPSKKKHVKLHVVFIPVSRDELIPSLIEGRGDIAVADVAITPKRKGLIDFSDPFFTKINEIVITGPSSPKINTLKDLSGKKVFIHHSSSHWEHLEKLNFAFSELSLDPIKLKRAPEQLETEDILEMVNTGLIGITVSDAYKAKLWSQILPDIVLHEDIPVKTDDEFAWMIRKNSPLLKKEINAFSKTHKEGTLQGNILLNRYIDKYKFAKHVTAKKEIEKFKKVLDLFRRYSEQYDLNHLLMIAQGYQESKLDQNAKSHVGAIGIMQLMPATGKEMKVGNIKKIEPNIHAGVKYHRFLADRYFKDEPMDELNKALFVFASYNAGPARIRRLRKEARNRGLDPNIWFDNVEVIAAEKIGSETVTYISNIYKYYVAYTLFMEKQEAKRKAKESLLPKTD